MLFDKKLSTSKRYNEIIELIKEKIVSGDLIPGDKLPSEQEMVDQLGVSRTSIREATKILEAIGVIKIRRGSGMFLTSSTSSSNLDPLIFNLILHSNEVDKLIEFRQYFEHMVVDLASINCTQDDLHQIEKILKKQRKNKDIDPEWWTDLDISFHHAILDCTRNPFAIELGRAVYELYRHNMNLLTSDDERRHTIVTHAKYLKSLKSKTNEDHRVLRRKIANNYERFRRQAVTKTDYPLKSTEQEKDRARPQ